MNFNNLNLIHPLNYKMASVESKCPPIQLELEEEKFTVIVEPAILCFCPAHAKLSCSDKNTFGTTAWREKCDYHIKKEVYPIYKVKYGIYYIKEKMYKSHWIHIVEKNKTSIDSFIANFQKLLDDGKFSYNI